MDYSFFPFEKKKKKKIDFFNHHFFVIIKKLISSLDWPVSYIQVIVSSWHENKSHHHNFRGNEMKDGLESNKHGALLNLG